MAVTKSEKVIRKRKALLAAGMVVRGLSVEAGYDAAVARFGAAATHAILDYRSAANVQPGRGGWSRSLEAALLADAPGGCPLPGADVRRGSRGPVVWAWQQQLRAVGWVVDADADFGPKTAAATTVALLTAGVDVKDPARPVVNRAAWEAVAKLDVLPGRSVRDYVPLAPRIIDARDGRAGFPVNATKRWGQRSETTIRYVIGHYTGGGGTFLADARFHVESPYLSVGGAPAIAYGLGVDYDGTLYVFNDAADITWHCAWNTLTSGVVFRGAAEGMTRAQERTMQWLLKNGPAGALARYGWPAAAWPDALSTHRHVRATSCPGEKGEAQYRALAHGAGLRWADNPRGEV